MGNANTTYAYEELFRRNIGVLTLEEQLRIRESKVAVAGVGGLGGPVVYLLARLGVGEIRIADPDVFSIHNINIQYGAYVDTIGKSKAEIISKDIARINPYLRIVSQNTPIDSENINEFLEGVDYVVDAIDFYEPEAEIILHREARERGLWVFMAQNASTIFSVITFNPHGMSFEDMLLTNGEFDMAKAIKGFFPVLPKDATPEVLEKVLNREHVEISAISTSPFIGASLLVEEMVKMIKNGKPLLEAPDLFLFDIPSLKVLFYIDGSMRNTMSE